MKAWIFIFFGIFFALLAFASWKSYRRNRSAEEFMLAGKSIGPILGFLTFSAALFSAFTFMGMPDFFRNHGIGAWTFLAFSDGVMVFFILWFGYLLRKKAAAHNFQGVAGLMVSSYGTKWAGVAMFASSFIFLIPYVAIQIRGISIFLEAAFPGLLPSWAWALLMVVMMLGYAEIGGLKAIVYSDAIQGLILLLVIWLIGSTCIAAFGNVPDLFKAVEEVNAGLLSTPGPKGLFSWQFLLGSMIAVVMIPVTQPQLTTRLVVVKDLASMRKMAYAVGIFAILVIAPTIFIGMYGAVKYPGAPTSAFLSQTLLFDQAPPVAALAIVGLFAACLSTTNAQIFALGNELRSLLPGDEKKAMRITRISLFFFAAVVMVFSTLMSDELALLARVSFTGTAMMAPIVLMAVITRRKPAKEVILISSLALIIYLLSLAGVVPDHVGLLKLDLSLYLFLVVSVLALTFIKKKFGRLPGLES
ncbi:MAG: sodium:solute symporter family protein [Bacteroidota bacterium]